MAQRSVARRLRKAGSSSVAYRDRVLRARGAASRFGVEIPAEGTAPPCAVAPRAVAHFFAPKTTHPFRRAAGFKIIEFILSTKKVGNKEIPFAVNKAALHIANIGPGLRVMLSAADSIPGAASKSGMR